MELPMVLSTSNGQSSPNLRHLGHVCPQRYCGALLWPGLSKSDLCDCCLVRRGPCNASTNPRDSEATRVYARTTSRVESTFNDPKGDVLVPPAVPGSATDSIAPSLKYPPLPLYLLPNSQLENTHDFEAEIGNKRAGHNSTSVSHQGRRSVNLYSSATSVPLYNYYGSCHKVTNVSGLTEEQDRTQHQQPHLCVVCQVAMLSRCSETICPGCRFDAASSKEKIGTDDDDYFSEPNEIVPKSNVEDELSAAVMSIFSNPKILDDEDDMDMEGIELSYPEVMDSEFVKELHLQPAQESSKGNLPSENVPQPSNPVVLDVAATLPKRKRTPKNSLLRSLRLCSSTGCTGIVSSESLATRCLGCVRRDWRSKISKGHAGHRVDDGRLGSGITKRSISTKTKKTVTWADEVSHTPAYECNPTNTQWRITSSVDSSSKYEILTGQSADMPILLDEDTPNIQVDGPSLPAGTRAPSERLEAPTIDPTTRSECLFEDTHVVIRAQDLSASASIPVVSAPNDDLCLEHSASSDVSLSICGASDLTDLSDSSDVDQSEDPSSSDSQETSPPAVTTGLKFRIPPRPGLYARKCGFIRCQQRVPATYRWKSCVVCRARSRECQRIRQNLQRRHLRLDEELLQSQITPVSRGIFSEDPPLVVAGARLCSVRDCTYIIPPFGEYRWKMCALCRLRARPNQTFGDISEPQRQDKTISQEFKNTARIAERLPKRGKQLPGRCQSLDCGMLLLGTLYCDQCIARRSWLINDSMRKAKSISAHQSKPRDPPPYPQYKAFPSLLADLKVRFNDFLQAQWIFFLHNAAGSQFNSAKFVFDAEYSIVALDFDIVGRKEAVDGNVLKLKGEIEHMGGIRFSPKRHTSILEGGGIAERFVCLKEVPVLQAVYSGQDVSTATHMKNMNGELEIAVVPDYSHPFLPGQRTIVRFRLLG